MIIDEEHKFVFVHIPKCAGNSVRSVLEEYDTTGLKFRPVATHPKLGCIDMTHIPLSLLREFFPDEYQKIKEYESFTVIRDPFRRFSSSMYQRLSMYGDKPVKELTAKEFHKEILSAIDFLNAHKDDKCLPYDYIHFQKQISYIYDQEQRVIKHVVEIKDINIMLSEIGNIIGDDITKGEGSPVTNNAVFYKSKLFNVLSRMLLPFYSPRIQRILPPRMKMALKNYFYESKDEKIGDLFENEYLQSFISDYYVEDIALYNAIKASV